MAAQRNENNAHGNGPQLREEDDLSPLPFSFHPPARAVKVIRAATTREYAES